MIYSGNELLWLFLLYSFLGWILETVTAAVKHKKFVNRGLVNAPFCILYGLAIIFLTIFFQELDGIWLFIGSLIVTTIFEWTAGHLIEKFYHEKWWDYSKIKWNIDGYIALPMSAIWAVLSMCAIKWGNELLLSLFYLLPHILGKIIIYFLFALLISDISATLIILSGRSRYTRKWEKVDYWLTNISIQLSKKIYQVVEKRIHSAYPEAKTIQEKEISANIFAHGCSFHKIVWLFIIGAFLGDITETIYCRITAGVWMSRSSVVWGPFSIVWGGAIALATMLLYKYKDSSDRILFFIGTFLGGAYEYVCSVFTEIVFGKVFWDYSHIPFNLGGRINLLYCFFWGIAAVVWMKMLYPKISTWIEAVPIKIGKRITWILIVFMCCNVFVSGLALIRNTERQSGIPAEAAWQKIIDARFDDARMEKIYPNMKNVN